MEFLGPLYFGVLRSDSKAPRLKEIVKTQNRWGLQHWLSKNEVPSNFFLRVF